MKCPYKDDCKYYVGDRGKCDDDKYTECQLVEFGLIEELIKKGWRL